MPRTSRSIASFAALIAGALVLVADSAGPRCETYDPLDVTYSYTVTCGDLERTSGEVTFTADHEDEGATAQVTSTGDVTFAGQGSWDVEECDTKGVGGHGTLTGLEIEASLTTEAGTVDFFCDALTPGEATTCQSSASSAEACTLSLVGAR